jgi:hypothetical protein
MANKMSNETYTYSKGISGLLWGYTFSACTSPFFNHTFYTERLSPPPSRAIKKMAQLYKVYTDVTCTAVCNNILDIIFKRTVALMYEYHFTHFSVYLSFWISSFIIIICIPHAAHLSYKELVWVTSEMIFLGLKSLLSSEYWMAFPTLLAGNKIAMTSWKHQCCCKFRRLLSTAAIGRLSSILLAWLTLWP